MEFTCRRLCDGWARGDLSRSLGAQGACSATLLGKETHLERRRPILGTIALLRLVKKIPLPSDVDKKEAPTVIRNPTPTSYISNGKAVTDKKPMRRRCQAGLHGAIEATGLVVVAVDTVFNLRRSVSCKHPVRNSSVR